jgi:HEAT repeat protein
MGLSLRKVPDVGALARQGDVRGLIAAAAYSELRTSRDGETFDVGSAVREAAILKLTDVARGEADAVVAEAIRDPADRVRCAAIRGLYLSGESVQVAEAVGWLPVEAPSRALAISAILKLADPKSAPVLARSLIEGSVDGLWAQEVEAVAKLCESTARRSPLGRVMSVLLEGLEDEREDVAGRAEDFLTWFGEDATRAVTAALHRSAAPERCVRILGRSAGAEALMPLIEALEHVDAGARTEACAALGELRDPLSVQALISATRDHDHAVRVAAASALDRIGTVAVLAALVPGVGRAPGERRNASGGGYDGAGRRSASARASAHRSLNLSESPRK